MLLPHATFLPILISACFFSFGKSEQNVSNLTETINSKKSTWKAGPNSVIPNIPSTKLKHLGGVLPREHGVNISVKSFQRSNKRIPDHFDSREEWPECASIIGNIRDQSDCGACWAFSSASVMSDRLCIHSNGKIKISVSAQDIVTCCSTCGKGCGGGTAISAFRYWAKKGIVSGGEYKSKNGCKSYTFDTCTHLTSYCGEENLIQNKTQCIEMTSAADTPKCSKTCDKSSDLTFSEDLTKGQNPYEITDERNIQMEILENGPIVGIMIVYQDFFCYKSGVYQKIGGKFVYVHAVKIIGWGVENGTNYWLIVNSWGEDWGDHGFFKILRGENECGIEEDAVAALPKKI